MRVLAACVVVLACLGCRADPPDPPATDSPNATLLRVIDGDTIDVRIDGTEERVRLIGIDTPETKKPDTPAECFGAEATANTAELLPIDTELLIVRDREARDVYGRLLAYVYRFDDALFVNLEIVREGYAVPLSIEPNVAHRDQFVAAARDAELANIGLWNACNR